MTCKIHQNAPEVSVLKHIFKKNLSFRPTFSKMRRFAALIVAYIGTVYISIGFLRLNP